MASLRSNLFEERENEKPQTDRFDLSIGAFARNISYYYPAPHLIKIYKNNLKKILVNGSMVQQKPLF